MARVVVVDPYADFREPLAYELRRLGHTVECASDSRSALACIIDNTPDAVILDPSISALDRNKLIDTLGSYIRLHSLPIIVLTSEPHAEISESAKHLRIIAVLEKGIASSDDVARAIDEGVSQMGRFWPMAAEKWRQNDISPL